MEVESEPEPVITSTTLSAPISSPINAEIPAALGTPVALAANGARPSSAASSPATSTRSLKRSAEMMEEDDNEGSNGENHDTEDRQDAKRKRLSDDEDGRPSTSDSTGKDGNENKDKANGNAIASTSKAGEAKVIDDGTNAARLVDEIGMELTCGCCTEMCYNPVIVLPCQHYYCGSCYTLWTRNGGVNCPSCRSPVSSIIPSRAIQSLIDVYLRAVPSRTRLPREKEQADEIYAAGQSIPVPTPRPRSPELTAPQDNDAYYHPCPHCASPNDFNWSCPVPIISPTVNLTFATLLTAATFPAGHARCGSCEHIHAPRAPTSSKCDFCLQSFCGLVVPTRCHAKRVREQKPLGMDSLMDILGNPEVYEGFGVNAVEFDYLLDYLTSKEISPRHIYAEIAEPLASTSDGWRPLLDRGIFPAVTDVEHAAPPAPASSTINNAPPQEQPSQTNSPETAVDEAPPPDSQPSDQDMVDNVPQPSHPTNEARSSETPAETSTPSVPNIAAEAQPEDTSHDTEMHIEAETIARAATPIIVPERETTPPVSEPTLDSLPVDVEVPQQQRQPEVPAAIPTTTAAEPVEQVVVVTLENNSAGEENGGDDDEGDGSDRSDRSSPPPPATNNNPNANATSAPPARSRGPHLHRICRACSAEVFFWGARAWWIKERAKAVESGELPENVRSRKDCPELGRCDKEEDNAHAREFNHIPHPPPSASTSGTTTATEDVQPADATTAEQQQSTGNAVNVPPVTENATANENTEAQERNSSPERPSRDGSAPPNTEAMDVDPPALDVAPAVPVENPTEVRPGADAGDEDHEMEHTSAPDLELESSENSIPSTSSGIGGLIAEESSAAGSHNTSGAVDGGEYSEKVISPLEGNGDLHMVVHEESEPPITSSSTRVA